MNRRTFLRATTATLALVPASELFAAVPASNTYRKNMGIQLYSVRGPLGKDTPGTLKAIAELGYKQVEMYGFPNCQAMIDGAKAAGLALNSTHFDAGSVINAKDEALTDFQKLLDRAKEVGLSHLVIPMIGGAHFASVDATKKTAEKLNKAAEKAMAAGIQLAYHNHAHEFKPFDGGKCVYDVFIEEFSKDMKFEIDVFWAAAAGNDPAKLIEKLSGRVSQLHLKDLKKDLQLPVFGGVPGDSFKEIGNGVINFEQVLIAAEKAGVQHCHVEQDQSPDIMASIKTSIANLAKL